MKIFFKVLRNYVHSIFYMYIGAVVYPTHRVDTDLEYYHQIELFHGH